MKVPVYNRRDGSVIRRHLGRFPLIARVNLRNLSICANQDSLQRVHNLPFLLVVGEPKEVRRFAHLLRRSGSELPMLESGIDIRHVSFRHNCAARWAVSYSGSMLMLNNCAFSKHLRALLQLLQHFAEVIAHQQAEIGHWAARVDERQQQRLAAKLDRDEWSCRIDSPA